MYNEFYPTLENIGTLKKGTLLTGKRRYQNNGLILELVDDFTPQDYTSLLEGRIKIINGGESTFNWYLSKYKGKEIEVATILQEIRETYEVDASYLFNILFLRKAKVKHKSIARFRELLIEIFKDDNMDDYGRFSPLLLNVSIVVLLIDLFKCGHELGLLAALRKNEFSKEPLIDFINSNDSCFVYFNLNKIKFKQNNILL